ncbi:unnamed protein product [Cylindrotheca closterium]|uniref:Uncharacterized protein n=1 Tax=Cylindrotheca closterium TaxID=2856 RepID=A0AAD2JL85_9STRA|nr:unnamed protein product [Cylindrotheca closterium]
MQSISTSLLALLSLILASTIRAEHIDLGLSQEIDLQRELHYAKSSKRSKKDWMFSPGSQRHYNSKYAQHSDAAGSEFSSRRHKRGHHHHQAGMTFDNFESWGLNRIKEALRNERASRTSTASSWRKSSTSSTSSASSSDSSEQLNDAPDAQEGETIHLDTLDAARMEKETP